MLTWLVVLVDAAGEPLASVVLHARTYASARKWGAKLIRWNTGLAADWYRSRCFRYHERLVA